ncbi:MAG: hypothetical protein LBI01_07045 [Elusimicrobium sp.]|jgi:hypothetical protein|nr:hypothetical protein [Elusimicrobium sp.]
MKKIFSVVLLFIAISAAAECLDAGFFSNTYSYVVSKDGLNYGCHAVRLNKDWFLTSAHCVMAAGNGESKISFNGAPAVSAKIFINGNFIDSVQTADDMALIKADGILPVSAKSVTLVTFDNNSYRVKGTFSAAFVGANGVSVSCIKGASVYFSGTRDSVISGFYLGGGYSGGGVWDENGNLMGIISGGGDGSFGYASFNADNMNFIESRVSGLRTKEAKSYASVISD